jgi:CheY-like chemotaxis protein/HPt (histidine-containing phosphotransfer) domain-containing protein
LQLCKINADTVESGQEAIDRMKENQYDLVFMDQMMPEMDGVQATKIIGEEMGLELPIIALTANAIIGTREMLLASGMNDFLSKPIIISSLHQILKQWLPAEKLLTPPEGSPLPQKEKVNIQQDLLREARKIEGLSVEIGLERVSGQVKVYEASLKLLTKEIDKCVHGLPEFLAGNDLNSFNIIVHSVKSSLANLGAMELSGKAKELEFASSDSDMAYCEENLPPFLEELVRLGDAVKALFYDDSESRGPIDVPDELREIFARMDAAFVEMDILAINRELESLEKLELGTQLNNKLEPLKDAILIMDYDAALEAIREIMDHEPLKNRP